MDPKDHNSFAPLDAALAASSHNVRKRGLWLFLIGGAVTAAVCFWLGPAEDWKQSPKSLLAPAVPSAFGLVGLIELVTGIGYGDWAKKWDSLRGWQRGIIGLLVAIAVFGLFALGVAIFM